VPPSQYKYWDETERAIKQFERADEIYKRALAKQEAQRKEIEAIDAVNKLDDLQSITLDLEAKKKLMRQMKQEEEERKKNLIELAAKLDDIHAPEYNQEIGGNNSKTKNVKNKQGGRQRNLANLIMNGQTTPPFKSKNTIIKRHRLAMLQRTQDKMQTSKNRLTLELFRVLEKVEIDRP
jgi:hypothetical protein